MNVREIRFKQGKYVEPVQNRIPWDSGIVSSVIATSTSYLSSYGELFFGRLIKHHDMRSYPE
jgi:hypothetical protein